MHDCIIRARTLGRSQPVADDQTIGSGGHRNGLTILYLTGQQCFGQRVLQGALDHAFQWAGTEDRIIAFIGQPFLRAIVQCQLDLADVIAYIQSAGQ